MAAGRGMRMMPLTATIPKPMAQFKGSTLIADAIAKIHGSIPEVYITVGYRGAPLAQHVIEHGVNAVFNTEGHGNAWWIYNTMIRAVDEPVLVLTCDNVVELDYGLIFEDYKKLGFPACMVVPVKPVEGLDGDYITHERNRITELNRQRPTDAYCSGIQVLSPRKVNEMTSPSDDFYTVWGQLIERSQLYCSHVYPKRWYAVDTVAQLNSINGMEQ